MCNLIEAAQTAERILLPKSDDCRLAIEAFVEATGIEIPRFEYRNYEARLGDKTFYSVSAKDIPRFVDRGYAEVGVTGYDQYLESQTEYGDRLRAQRIGSPMCFLALLSPKNTVETIRRIVSPDRFWKSPVDVATSFPNIVNTYAALNDENMRAIGVPISGSVEVMTSLMGCSAVVDIVRNGETCAINGLTVVKKLLDIYPAIIGKA